MSYENSDRDADVDPFAAGEGGPPDVETKAELRATLQELLVRADENGVNPLGSWPVALPENVAQGWDIEITSVRRQAADNVRDGDRPTSAVVAAVAERKGVEPTALPPLAGAVDVDALDAVVRGDGGAQVTFEYAGYRATVDEDGQLFLVEE
ncbi:MAG: HalOD1 output domain-containing protein [Haloarculaceae archaeon]